jgi:transposase
MEVEGMLADELDHVIGVDTHRDRHALALVAARSGGVVGGLELPASAGGYRQALAFARRHAPGRRLWAIEGTGCYGAGLARYLASRGERVVEVERPARTGGRSRGKSDALDAVRAARSALADEKPISPRRGDTRESLRALVTTRAGAVATKQTALRQLRSLLVCVHEPLRAELRPLSRSLLLRRCAGLRPRAGSDHRGVLVALRCCAQRDLVAEREANELEREIQALVARLAPTLLEEPGVGPISAAQLLISWSHPGRLHSEAAFARLAGAAPIPASSGQTIRHRLDRGGDRQLNRALHTIITSRRKHHPATIAYINRRTSEGKNTREAIRCLKRYLAHQLYRLLETMPTPT